MLFCKELLRGRYKRKNQFESFCFSIDRLNLIATEVAKKEQVRTNAKNAFLKVFCPSNYVYFIDEERLFIGVQENVV